MAGNGRVPRLGEEARFPLVGFEHVDDMKLLPIGRHAAVSLDANIPPFPPESHVLFAKNLRRNRVVPIDRVALFVLAIHLQVSIEQTGATAIGTIVDFLLLLADISDNPGGGSAQDGTVLLAALLDAGVEDAALATIYDPDAVEAAAEAGVGAEVSLSLGGRSGENGDPLDVTGRVRLLSDGNYRNYGPMSTGLAVSFGRTALLEVDGIDVLVGSHRQQPYDPEAFRSQGITPERERVLVLKSTVHYRAAFDPLVGAVREVATPGLCTPDLSAFDYEHVPRPIYPLDDVV